MRKKIIILIVVLAVTAGVALWASRGQKSTSKQSQKTGQQSEEQQPAPPPLKVTKSEVDASKLPSQFPANIPIESGAKITQNYNASAENGLYQATRAFESAKTLDENFKLYSDFVQRDGWKLLTGLNQDKLKVIAAQKDKANLQITMSVNSQSGKNIVEISYTVQTK